MTEKDRKNIISPSGSANENGVQASDVAENEPSDAGNEPQYFFEQTTDTPAGATDEIRKRANKYFLSKVVFNLLLIIIGALIVGLFLRQMQMRSML